MYNNVWHQQICGTGVSRTGSCGLAMEYGEFVDSVRISNPIIEPFYTPFRNVKYSGKVMLHCHDLMLGDNGMIGSVNTVGGPDNLPLQEQSPCDGVRQQAKGKKSNGKGKGKGKVKTGVVG